MVQASSEHNVLSRRKQLEEARSNLLANTEQEFIERAKRDQELDLLQNEELKQKLKLELEQLRAERDSLREQSFAAASHAKHQELMDLKLPTEQDQKTQKAASVTERDFVSMLTVRKKAYQALMQSEIGRNANA